MVLRNEAFKTAVVRASFFGELFSSLFAFTRLMLSSPQTLVTNALNFAVTWWRSLGPELPPLQQVQDFKLSFNKKYDEVDHEFYLQGMTMRGDDNIDFRL